MYILKSLRAKYKDTPWFTVPYVDEKGVALTGQHNMSKQELGRQPVLIDKNTQYPLSHNEVLDEDKPEQKAKLEMIKHLPEVAESQSKADPVKHIFFLYNAEDEATEVVDNFERKMKAMDIVSKNSSEVATKDLAYFLGIDPRRHSVNVLKKMIYQEADKNPEKINAFNGEKSKDYLFVRKLVKNEVITKSNGGFYFNEILLGYQESEVVGFLNNDDNKEIKERLGKVLMEKK